MKPSMSSVPPNPQPKILRKTRSGIGSPGGPLPMPEITLETPVTLEGRWGNLLAPSHERKLIVVKCLNEHCKLKIPRDYLVLRVTLGIDDLPETPSSWFLNEFFGSKTFAFFDLRNQGRIVEEVTDTLLRFSSLVPVVVLVVATDSFGRGVEASLRVKAQSSQH